LEYLELWPSWIRACARYDVPIVVVDGSVSHRSLRIAPLLRRAAGQIATFCAQTLCDAENARKLGVPSDRIRIHGNGKYDGLIGQPPALNMELSENVGLVDVVVGSLHPDEEKGALEALAGCPYRVLFAPRYPQRTPALIRRARSLGIEMGRRSLGARGHRWVVLDSMGELAAAYALGKTAIVGGTFGRRGGQNLIEPAAHGLPVIFGPHHPRIILEVSALRDRGGWLATDWRDAAALVGRRLLDPGPDPRLSLDILKGATDRNLEVLLPYL